MDGGPFRAPQSADRRGVTKPESTHRPSDEADMTQESSTYTNRPSARRSSTSSTVPKWLAWLVCVVIILGVLGFGGWLAWSQMKNHETDIDSSKYQAVFLTNGLTYFGKLKSYNNEYFELTDIFYLQSQTSGDESPSADATSDATNFQLIKYGNEVYGPEDEMIISKRQVLHYENLQSSGKVVKAINDFNSKNE